MVSRSWDRLRLHARHDGQIIEERLVCSGPDDSVFFREDGLLLLACESQVQGLRLPVHPRHVIPTQRRPGPFAGSISIRAAVHITPGPLDTQDCDACVSFLGTMSRHG